MLATASHIRVLLWAHAWLHAPSPAQFAQLVLAVPPHQCRVCRVQCGPACSMKPFPHMPSTACSKLDTFWLPHHCPTALFQQMCRVPCGPACSTKQLCCAPPAVQTSVRACGMHAPETSCTSGSITTSCAAQPSPPTPTSWPLGVRQACVI